MDKITGYKIDHDFNMEDPCFNFDGPLLGSGLLLTHFVPGLPVKAFRLGSALGDQDGLAILGPPQHSSAPPGRDVDPCRSFLDIQGWIVPLF